MADTPDPSKRRLPDGQRVTFLGSQPPSGPPRNANARPGTTFRADFAPIFAPIFASERDGAPGPGARACASMRRDDHFLRVRDAQILADQLGQDPA